MLQDVCEYLNNYFILDRWEEDFSISDGVISPVPPLKEGQRFWLTGSALNDGVYTYYAEGIRNDDDTEAANLRSESFTGTIAGMGVPPSVSAIAAEIGDWTEQYADALNSPYFSESVIGVYSYQKSRSNASSSADNGDVTWQTKFASRLKRWKKVCL